MWLSILKGFLDERDRYHAGEVRFVADEDAAMRFIGRNWAKRVPAPNEAAPAAEKGGEPVSLSINKSTLGQKETKHG